MKSERLKVHVTKMLMLQKVHKQIMKMIQSSGLIQVFWRDTL